MTMRAARYYGKEDIRLETVDEPHVAAGQVLVDVEWCGICGSDLHEYIVGSVMVPSFDRPHPVSGIYLPITLGHELCGRVNSAPPGSKLRAGDAVMIDPRVPCRACSACQASRSHCCAELGYIGGSTGFGGFGERVAVGEDLLYVLPPEIPLEYAAIIEPLAVVHHAIKTTGILDWKDRDVLVIGGGPIGFALLLCLNALGATNVIVSEPALIRRKQVTGLARAVIHPIKEDVRSRCLEYTDGRGVEVVFDCAGVPVGLRSGFEALRYEGMFVMVAVYEKPVEIPSFELLRKHITMKGTLIFNDEDMREVMEMMVQGRLAGYEKMVTSRVSLDDIVARGFEELVHNKDEHIKILVSPK